MASHWNMRFGAKILDDYLLDVTISILQLPNRQQGINSLVERFTDPDQNPGREWDSQAACLFDHL